ncbi:MAG: acyloxyacyl hydrolase [Acidobacteriota bacterium]
MSARAWIVTFLFLATLSPTAGFADEARGSQVEDEKAELRLRPDATIFDSADEWNLSLGGGYAHVIRNSAGDISVAEQGIRWGRVFSPSHGEHWHQGAWQFGLEFHPVFLVLQGETVYGSGVTPSIRRVFTAHGKMVPTLAIGLGILATTEKVPEGESRFNFTPQLGLGFYYFLRPRRALVFEYRFHHISNAGRTDRNPSINSSMLVVGFSWFR